MAFNRRPTAVVTGASYGIGAEITNTLLSQGWNVCLVARSTDAMNKIASKYNSEQSLIVRCDLNDTNSVINGCKQIIKWCPQYLNLLINNAGFGVYPQEMEVNDALNDGLMSKSIKIWDDHMNVLLRSPMIFTKYLIHLLKNGVSNPIQTSYGLYDGSIINVSSVVSGPRNRPALTPYSVAKAGLNQMTRLNAFELSGKYGIRCNGLIVGPINTRIFKTAGFTPEKVREIISLNPIGRMGTTNDMNEMFLFLADKQKSGYITGALIDIDGGAGLVGVGGNPYKDSQRQQSKL